jgi:hypothetical protein
MICSFVVCSLAVAWRARGYQFQCESRKKQFHWVKFHARKGKEKWDQESWEQLKMKAKLQQKWLKIHLHSVELNWTVSNSFERFQTHLNGFKLIWMVPNSFERFQTHLNGFKLIWTVSSSFERFQTHLNGFKLIWTVSNSFERSQTILNCFKSKQNRLTQHYSLTDNGCLHLLTPSS